MADKKEKYVSGEEHQAMSRNPRKPDQPEWLSSRNVGVVIVVIVLCGLSFLGGTAYGKHSQAPTTTASAGFRGSGGPGGGRFSNGGGFGQVTAVSSSSITLQNPMSGTSNTYSITSSTGITDNGQTVTASDIQVGDTIIVRVASSGSTTASSIIVNPNVGGGGGGGAVTGQ